VSAAHHVSLKMGLCWNHSAAESLKMMEEKKAVSSRGKIDTCVSKRDVLLLGFDL
jgi:hypothetical protein